MRQVLQSKPLVNVLSWRQKSPKNRLKQKIRFLRNCTPQATKNLGFQPLQYPTKKIETEGNFYHVRPNFGFGGTVSQQLSKIFLFCKKILVPYEQGYRICSNKQRVHPQKMKFLCFNICCSSCSDASKMGSFVSQLQAVIEKNGQIGPRF